MEFNANMDFLKRLVKGIASQFGPNCEVVLHDLSQDLEHTIVAIENGHISGREVGDGASEIVLETIGTEGELHDKYNYHMRTNDGRVLKASSICIRDDSGKVIGILGINYDITDLLVVQNSLTAFTTCADDEAKGLETIPSNVDDLLEILIDESVRMIGKPVAVMTREDKMRAIQYLEKKGAFRITKSGDKISKFFDISKFTLYNYMNT